MINFLVCLCPVFFDLRPQALLCSRSSRGERLAEILRLDDGRISISASLSRLGNALTTRRLRGHGDGLARSRNRMRSCSFGEGSVAHGALVSQKLHTLPCELGLQPSPSSITRLSPALRVDTAHFGQQLLAWHGSRFRLGIALDHHHDEHFLFSHQSSLASLAAQLTARHGARPAAVLRPLQVSSGKGALRVLRPISLADKERMKGRRSFVIWSRVVPRAWRATRPAHPRRASVRAPSTHSTRGWRSPTPAGGQERDADHGTAGLRWTTTGKIRTWAPSDRQNRLRRTPAAGRAK